MGLASWVNNITHNLYCLYIFCLFFYTFKNVNFPEGEGKEFLFMNFCRG